MSEWTEIKNESGYKIHLLDTEMNQFWIFFLNTKYFNWIELNSLEIDTQLILSQWYLMSYFIAISLLFPGEQFPGEQCSVHIVLK